MKDELLRYNDNQKYLVFDFETCNLNLVNPDNKPWQLSFITCTKNKILEKHDHFLKWKNLKVSEGAQKATRFDHTKYRIKSEDPLPVLRKFDELLYDKQYKIVGHNLLGFDIYIHNTFRKAYGLKSDFSYLSRLIDTNSLAKASKEDIKFNKKDSFLSWQFRLDRHIRKGLKTNMGAMLRELDVDFDKDKLHDSMYDIQMNLEIFRKLLWKVDI